ncbi:MAG: sugar phosphate isomerase/epimerase [Thermoprotei archaeon]|nr:sugar phosphate isomerase/epimerase [Thermoprotei archaeon]
MIYLGLPVWYGSGRLIDLIQVVHERGFDYVEISLDYPWPEAIDEFEMEELVKSIRGYGIEVGIHGPWRDISLGSPRDVIRRAALKVYRRCVEFASRLESHYFNFHVFTKEATEYEEVYKAAYAATRRSVKEICRMCKEANIIPTLENNPTDFLGSVDEIWGLLKENEGLRACLDVGHVKGANMKKKGGGDELSEWFKRLRGRIEVIHLHDYKVEGDRVLDHLVLGKGELNIAYVIDEVRKSGAKFLLLEMFLRHKNKRASIEDLGNILISLREKLR